MATINQNQVANSRVNQVANSNLESLNFNETLTVEQFKDRMQVSSIQVKENPSTGKLLFTYGGKIGAVSSKGIPENPMISNVSGDNGEFWLLHNAGLMDVPVLAEF